MLAKEEEGEEGGERGDTEVVNVNIWVMMCCCVGVGVLLFI